MEELKKNYMALIAKNQNLSESFDNFFNCSVDAEDEINHLINKIKQYQKNIEEAEQKLNDSYAKKYKENYTPVKGIILCNYTNRNGDTFYYIMPSGQGVDYNFYKDKKHILIKLDTKSGYVTCLDGYAYEIGGIVTKNYKYNITPDNSRMVLALQTEQIIPFFEEKSSKTYSSNGKYVEYSNGILGKINATEFLNTIFGVSKSFKSDLRYYKNAYNHNKSFETILKTAPDELIEPLLNEKYEENKPVYQLIGCTKETYNKAVAEGLTVELYEIAPYMKEEVTDKYGKSVNIRNIFNMTENDWLEMIKAFKEYEKDLEFYGIPTNEYLYGYGSNINVQTRKLEKTQLLSFFAHQYLNTEVFNKNYSFGKLVRYTIDETINQGYSRVSGFLEELRDYLMMCKSNLTIPYLYSSMLKLTHDISARNHRVTVTPEDELKFQEKYKDFKDVTLKLEELEYHVIAPKNTIEIKKEGDNLSHCVASYIKRIIDGESLIYFLRKDKVKSLITLEVKDGKITQARGMNNRQPNEEEIKFIKKFAEKDKLEIAY